MNAREAVDEATLLAGSARMPQDRMRGKPAAGPREQTRRRLLRAAAVVFGSRGFEAGTVEDILRQARLSRRTYYQFFADKQEALTALYQEATERLLENYRARTAEGANGRERVLRALDAYLHYVAQAGPLVRVLSVEAIRPLGPLAARRRWLHQRLIRHYQAGFAVGDRRPDPLLLRSAILLTESLCMHLLTQTTATAAQIRRARRVLRQALGRMLDD